jgi:hypothetical protein
LLPAVDWCESSLKTAAALAIISVKRAGVYSFHPALSFCCNAVFSGGDNLEEMKRRTENLKIPALLFILLLLTVQNAGLSAQVVYVDAGAAGANNGSSWSDACNHLQDALAYTSAPAEVWVAEGAHRPDSNSADPNGSGDREAAFELISGVALYGGFPTGGGPWDSRDPNMYKTLLSGDLAGNDSDVEESCDLLTDPTRAENSYHVVILFWTDETAVLDGFTITGGNANGTYPEDCGGGLFCWVAGPRITSCTFAGNSAGCYGGAMFNYAGSPVLTDCAFNGNSSDPWTQWGGGGGIYNESGYSTLDNCVVRDNCAAYGGGMWNYDASPVFISCRFTENVGNRFGGAMANHISAPTLIQCSFSDGYSTMGGGIYNSDSYPEIIDSTLIGNSADWWGGGIYNYRSEPNLSNCTIALNTAGIGAGGIYAGTTTTLTMTNCTLTRNSAPEASGLACDSYQMQYPSNLQVTNCILWDGANEIWNNDGSTISIRYSDIMGDWSGPGNIDADPCFADPNAGDFHLKSQAGCWRPNAQCWVCEPNSSPCIDAGDPNSDWTRELWPHGEKINMGACGGTPQASMSSSSAGNIADLNNDDSVNHTDLMLFSQKWLYRQVLLSEDLDRNAIVNFVDFAILAQSWLWAQ